MPQRRRTTEAIQVRARQLRQEQTPAEARLWEQLRDRQLDGFKFRRQHPIGRFIVDFYCPKQRLVVEVDGLVHTQQLEYDDLRTASLQAEGYRVIRYTNAQIDNQLDIVLNELRHALHSDDHSIASAPSPAADEYTASAPSPAADEYTASAPSPAAAGEMNTLPPPPLLPQRERGPGGEGPTP